MTEAHPAQLDRLGDDPEAFRNCEVMRGVAGLCIVMHRLPAMSPRAKTGALQAITAEIRTHLIADNRRDPRRPRARDERLS